MTNPDALNEPQAVPGGPDAVEHDRGPTEQPVGRDLPPDLNPATDEELPEEIAEPDDKDQEPEEGVSGEDEPPDEPPA